MKKKPTILAQPKLSLADWKEIETDAEYTLKQALKSLEIAKILYSVSTMQVKLLGGLTNEEERKESRKNTI